MDKYILIFDSNINGVDCKIGVLACTDNFFSWDPLTVKGDLDTLMIVSRLSDQVTSDDVERIHKQCKRLMKKEM